MTTREAARAAKTQAEVVAIGLATFGAVHLVAAMLAANATGTVLLQALAAEVGAGRAGVAWSSTAATQGRAHTPARRAAFGAIWGLGFAVLLVGAGLATGGLALAKSGGSSIATLLLGGAVSVAGAVRDELLLRGVPLLAFRGKLSTLPLLAAVGACGIAASPELGSPAAIAARFAFAVAFATIWMLDGGAFKACGAHATLAFAAGPLVSGGAFDLRAVTSSFTSNAGLLATPAAAVFAFGGAAAVVLTMRAARRRD